MQIDQTLRRLVWRVRRWFSGGADNDPVVTVEGTPPPSPSPNRRKLVRTVVAFLATLALLAAGYGLLVAFNSRAPLDGGVVPAAGQGESNAVAGAATALGYASGAGGEPEYLFVPSARGLRQARIAAGAARASAAFVAHLAAARGRPDPALEDARAALEAGSGPDRAAARDALIRLNARIARGQARVDTGAGSLADLVRIAADACDAEAAALQLTAQRPTLLASPAADARLSESRGVAWAWLLIVRGAMEDAPETAQAVRIEASVPLDALARIAERQPLILSNAAPGTPWAPAHIAEAAAQFTRAAVGARALAAALEVRG